MNQQPGKARASGGKKPLSIAEKRTRDAQVHRWVRYGVQFGFFAMAPALFSGAFNGVKYICTQIGLGSAIEPTSFVIQLVALLAFTFVFGRFFCGYACAFGTLGDYLFNAFEFARVKAGAIANVEFPRPKVPDKLVSALSFLKFAVLVAICASCFLGVWANVSSNSPWVAFAAALAGSIDGIGWLALVLLGLVVVGMIMRERFFCQFLCPLGAVFSLMPVMPFSEFVRMREHCAKNCGRCHEACPVDIWPDADAIKHGECISCGRCADACPMGNVNMIAIEKEVTRRERLAKRKEQAKKAQDSRTESASRSAKTELAEFVEPIAGTKAATRVVRDERAINDIVRKPTKNPARRRARPLRKTREAWYLLRGSEISYVLIKTALLFVLCWAVGAARYVPPLLEVLG